jgi:diguanylate cyclase (GGDEF)-like protein
LEGRKLISVVARKMLVFVMPAATLVAAYFCIPYLPALKSSHREILEILPYLLSSIGMLLAVHFHRGRPFLVLLLLVLFYWCFRTFIMQQADKSGLNGIYQIFVLILPLNYALIAMMREKGVFSYAGRMRLAFLAIQSAAAWWLFRYHYLEVQPFILRKFSLLPLLDCTAVPQTAILIGGVSATLIAVMALRRQTPVDSGILGALVSFFVAAGAITNSDIFILFSSAGALIVTLSVLLDSYNMAFRDDLTGIPSRRALNESLHGIGRRYVIAMLDVDHFKQFNDSYGHDVGDQVLKMVARKIRDVGGGGKAYRYGGEEFAVLFPGRRVDYAIPHLEKLRESIASYSLVLRSQERPKESRQGKGQRGRKKEVEHVSVTISIGVAESGGELDSPEMVMKAADTALYKAKSRGRNRVCK